MVNDLIKIADYLDQQGKEKEANLIDGIIKVMAFDYIGRPNSIEIPEDEREMLKAVLTSLQESLSEEDEPTIDENQV
jgi:hypothetical protein